MRISNSLDTQVHYMQTLQHTMGTKQTQLSTGKSFNRVSEDPLRANQLSLVHSAYGRIEQFQKNVEDLKGFLAMTESTLGNAVSILSNAREKGIFAKNDTFSDSDKETFAKEVEQSIQHVVGLANTKFMGKYIFSGEKSQTESFTYDGNSVTYNGDTTPVSYRISDASDVQISETGDVAFEGILNALITLRDEIRTGSNADIENAIGVLDAETDQFIDLRSEIGVRMNMVEGLNEIYESSKIDLTMKKETIEGVDYAKVLLEFTNAQRLYQGTIQASVKASQTTILNYI